MDTSERLREVANLRYALQSKSRLRLEFLGELSKLLRVHGQPVRDELLSSLVLAIPDELPGEGYASSYNEETVYGSSTPPTTGIPPKTPPRPAPEPTGIPPKTEPRPAPERTGIPPKASLRPYPQAGQSPEPEMPQQSARSTKATAASSRKRGTHLNGNAQTLKPNRKKRTSRDTALSGDAARGTSDIRRMG